jgi:hypothetical protein
MAPPLAAAPPLSRPGRAVDPSDAVLKAAVDAEMARLRVRLVRFLGRDPASAPPPAVPRPPEPAPARTAKAGDLSLSVAVSVSVPAPARVPRAPVTTPPPPVRRHHRSPRVITVASGWGERRRA